jgi:hypothetical protein
VPIIPPPMIAVALDCEAPHVALGANCAGESVTESAEATASCAVHDPPHTSGALKGKVWTPVPLAGHAAELAVMVVGGKHAPAEGPHVHDGEHVRESGGVSR